MEIILVLFYLKTLNRKEELYVEFIMSFELFFQYLFKVEVKEGFWFNKFCEVIQTVVKQYVHIKEQRHSACVSTLAKPIDVRWHSEDMFAGRCW